MSMFKRAERRGEMRKERKRRKIRRGETADSIKKNKKKYGSISEQTSVSHLTYFLA